MKGAFKGKMHDGQMMLRLMPSDGSLVQDKAGAVRLLKNRKSTQKAKMVKNGNFSEAALKAWILRTQA